MKDDQPDLPPGQAPLLRNLPLELRRQIYDYIVTDDGHASVVKVSGRDDPQPLFRLYPRDPEKQRRNCGLNQLRFVCRQLYWEASGLGLGDNVLHFETLTDPVHSAASCVQFLGLCSQARLASISKIEILELAGRPLVPSGIRTPWDSSSVPGRWSFGLFDLEAIPKLVEFCLKHPRVSIDITLSGARICNDISGFYMGVSVLLLAVRKQRMKYPPAPTDVHLPVEAMSRVWEGYGVEAKPLPKNLRFYTDFEIREDDAALCRGQPWWDGFQAQMQTWQKEGI